eukprot:gene16465-22687_t
MDRIEELEAAIAAALKVNKHLNVEIEAYVCALDKTDRERLAWKKHAETLAKQLSKSRKEETGIDDAEILSKMLEDHSRLGETELPDQNVDSKPTTSQMHLVNALSAKGAAAGWLVDASEIIMGEVLGQGSFGTTYRATWRGASVAVKCVRIDAGNELGNFLREVEALSALRHPHVVPFLGACIKPESDQCWLLTEFMSGGTLSSWIYQGQARSNATVMSRRPFVERLRMAFEVSKGMEALEACQPPLLHRDLKPTNILVDGGGHARIGDFGLAKRLIRESVGNLTGETGTYLYMAPEVMRHDVYDGKADVWSWGVMFTELLTCQLPYAQTFMTPVQNKSSSTGMLPNLASSWGAVLGRIYTGHSKVTNEELAAAKERLFAARKAFISKLEAGAFDGSTPKAAAQAASNGLQNASQNGTSNAGEVGGTDRPQATKFEAESDCLFAARKAFISEVEAGAFDGATPKAAAKAVSNGLQNASQNDSSNAEGGGTDWPQATKFEALSDCLFAARKA